MRNMLYVLLVLLACAGVMNCGNSSPTGPEPTPSGGSPPPSGGSPTGGGTPTGQTAVTTDGTFDDNDWDDVVQVSGAGGTGGGSHLSFNGQQGADYRRVTISVNSASGGSPSQVAVFAIHRRATYFPSSDGAIFSVDHSEDSILLSGGGNGQYSAPALRQNGKLYTLLPGGGAFATPERSWTRHSLTGLRQNDFRTIASASDHPDFSSTGTRIDVGFMRLVTVPAGGGAETQVGGIDNWRLTLHR